MVLAELSHLVASGNSVAACQKLVWSVQRLQRQRHPTADPAEGALAALRLLTEVRAAAQHRLAAARKPGQRAQQQRQRSVAPTRAAPAMPAPLHVGQVVAPRTGSPLSFDDIQELAVGTFKDAASNADSPDVRQVCVW